jgi:hypothetical protein
VEVVNEVFSFLGGANIVLAALFAFISKIWISRIVDKNKFELQVELNNIQNELNSTNKKLDAEFQNSIYISQIQLEHEYKIYQSVWALLIDLRNSTMRLRPMMDYVDPKKSKEEIIRERLCVFGKNYNTFAMALEQNKPFYPQEVYDVLDSVSEKCRHESIDSEYIERKNSDYYKEAQKNKTEIIDLINKSCSVIRKRLSDVRVK